MSVTIDNSGSSIEIKNNGALLVTMSGTQGPAGPPGDPADNTDWGDIGGTLSDQTDLQAALDLKADDSDLTDHTGDANIHFGDAPSDGEQYARKDGAWEVTASEDPSWGGITGTLSDQTDLQAALDTKYESGDSPTFDDLTLDGDITLSDGSQITNTGETVIDTDSLQINLGGAIAARIDTSNGSGFVDLAMSNTPFLRVAQSTGKFSRLSPFGLEAGASGQSVDLYVVRLANGNCGIGVSNNQSNDGTLELADIIASGDIEFTGLPTSDPASDGRLWSKSGNVRVSGQDSDEGNGFADYNNTDNPTTIPADTWVTIPNDGLGAFSNSTYIPEGITRLMDTSTGEFDFSELALGDTVLIRNDFSVNPDTNNALLEMRYQLGTGGGAYTLETVMGRLDDGSGKDYRFSLKPDLIYMGDSNTRDNPVTLQIRLSTSGTVSNAGSVIQLIRK